MLEVFLGSLFGTMLGNDGSPSKGISLKDFNLSEEFHAPTFKKCYEKSFFRMINLYELTDKIIKKDNKEIIILRVYLKEMWKNEGYPIHLCEVMCKKDYEKIKDDLKINYSPLFFSITDKDGFICPLGKNFLLEYPIIFKDKELDIIQVRDKRLWTTKDDYEVILCEVKNIT